MKEIYIALTLIFLFEVSPAQIVNVGGTGSPATWAGISPYHIEYTGRARMQYIYRASDLIAAGATAGRIDTIAFYRASTSSAYTISGSVSGTISTTSSSTASSTSFRTGSSTSSSSLSISRNLVRRWNKIPLSQPMYWNGTSNILITICTSAPSTTPGAGSNVNFTSTSYRSTASGSSPFVWCSSITPSGSLSQRPVIQFIFANVPPLSATTSARPESCTGKNDGAAAVSVSNGFSPYSITWSNSATTPQISGLTAGNYSVTISDASNSNIVRTVNVPLSPPLSVSFSRVQNVSCNGASDGEIDVNVNNGIPPLTYNWSNASNNINLRNLSSGSYALLVIDNAGCRSNIQNVSITEPAQLTANLTATPENCIGSQDGGITSSVSGGTAPYAYQWSNMTNAASPDSLAAGTYSVTITDQNSCSFSNSATVNNLGNLNTTVNTRNTTMLAIQSNVSYQWLDCSNSFAPIANETSRTFTATQNGIYAVELTRGGCKDTSTCIPIISVGLSEASQNQYLINYNQSSKLLTITSNSSQFNSNSDLLIFNVRGQKVYENSIVGKKTEYNLQRLKPGIHIVRIGGLSKKIMVY